MVETREIGGWDGKRALKVRDKGAITDEVNSRFNHGVTSWTCSRDMETSISKKKVRSNAIVSKELDEKLDLCDG
ncbi:hypothetical protein SLEP1_g23455 [Rubroshorea leprosula]|uniref:Uncharacterized protein n=1 Tax=Rubroshorea leprosula TaxID=152421 RepID=A0AAV5JL77_9ROSI|nr:hypothetical protein SLEP1_g23455 [Rubroshorea leprosula]